MNGTAEKLEHRFDVGTAPRVSVSNPDGSISIVPGPDGVVRVAVLGYDPEDFDEAQVVDAVVAGPLAVRLEFRLGEQRPPPERAGWAEEGHPRALGHGERRGKRGHGQAG